MNDQIHLISDNVIMRELAQLITREILAGIEIVFDAYNDKKIIVFSGKRYPAGGRIDDLMLSLDDYSRKYLERISMEIINAAPLT